jgi:hypothetical protein
VSSRDRRARPFRPAVAAIWFALAASLAAQGPPGGRVGGPPPTAKAAARADFTGYWVSIVSEDWRWRMITPARGDYANIPINAAARAIADAWDPAKDQAAGEACKAYAAPAIMREPGRLQIAWQDDNTLKIETDAGMQTRVLRFAVPGNVQPAGEPTWQGTSVARWEAPPRGTAGNTIPLGLGARAGTDTRTLEVTTTRIRPGYLRKNGVPFSAETSVTEYFDFLKDPDGVDWFVVTTIVRDQQYLNGPWVTTSHFKKEPNGAKWKPTPCSVR